MIQRLLPLIAALLLLVAAAGGGFVLHRVGFSDGVKVGRSEGDVKVEKLARDHAELIAKKEKEARERLETLTTRLQSQQHSLNEMASQLADQQRDYRTATERLTGELNRVTTQYRRSLDAAPEPLPACVFTRDFVRLYDDATGAYPMPETRHPGGAAASSDTTDAAWQLDSGISQRTFLAHHIRYAEQCRATAAQLNKLIDAMEVSYAP
ncbi:MAG: hypothetical protein ACRC4V_03945 [Aeromonas veronii]